MPRRRQSRTVSGPHRAAALVLALIWLIAGLTGVAVALWRAHWSILLPAAFAVWYGLLWWRVAMRRRLLTWGELAIPWRARPDR